MRGHLLLGDDSVLDATPETIQQAIDGTKFFWLDMEMTGLDIDKEVVIEVAAIVTDTKLNTLDSYHAIVKQPAEFIERMDEWNRRTQQAGEPLQCPSRKHQLPSGWTCLPDVTHFPSANDKCSSCSP